VHQVGAVAREQPSRVVPDDSPVPDGEELGLAPHPVDGEVIDHARDVLRAAGVLHVEEDGPPGRGQRPFRP